MKKINRIVLCFSMIFSLSFSAYAFDETITVKFKSNISEQSLKQLNQMTNTRLLKKIDSRTYQFEFDGIINSDKYESYIELFSLMSGIESMYPLPKYKIADNINPQYYISKTLNSTKTADNKNSENQALKLNDNEFMVKFNQKATPIDISNLNNASGVNATYLESMDAYKVTIPENTNPEDVMNLYQLSGIVSSLVPPSPQAPASPSPDNQGQELRTENKQEGLFIPIPLNGGRDVKITLRVGEDQKAIEWINRTFSTQLVSKEGFNAYIIRFPQNVNLKKVVRVLSLCEPVYKAEISYQ